MICKRCEHMTKSRTCALAGYMVFDYQSCDKWEKKEEKIKFIDIREDKSMPLPEVEILIIDGIEITTYSAYDGMPIKNEVPQELRERLKTRNQWFELGFVPKTDAVAYDFHPNDQHKLLRSYYLDTDVISSKDPSAPTPKICKYCEYRYYKWCPIAGDKVPDTHHCSEWEEKRENR